MNLQEQLDTWWDEYEVASPDELHERAAETERAEATRDMLKTASDWDYVLYRLSIVEETIENYKTGSRDHIESA